MKRHETILKYIGDGEYTADMEENAEGGWVLADEAQRLLTEARAEVESAFRDGGREPTRERDAHRRALNKIADRLGVVHEDDKIVAAVLAALRERDEAREDRRRIGLDLITVRAERDVLRDEARARPALTEEDRTVLAGLHTDLDDELACVPDDSTRGRWLARHIAVLDRLLAAPAPSHQACEGVHASAPAGMSCADCTIDGEPCPDCYAAAWRKRHPNVIGARPAPRAVTSEQVQAMARCLDDWRTMPVSTANVVAVALLADLGIEVAP